VGLQEESGQETSWLNKGQVGEWEKHFVGERLENMAREMKDIAKDIYKKHGLGEINDN